MYNSQLETFIRVADAGSFNRDVKKYNGGRGNEEKK